MDAAVEEKERVVGMGGVALMVFSCLVGTAASASTIFLMGDLTPAFDLTEAPPHTKVDDNNRELLGDSARALQ